MKKSILLIFALLCSSCQQPRSPILVFSYSGSVVEVNGKLRCQCLDVSSSLPEMLESRLSFPLFVYVPGCGSCDVTALQMDQYLKDNPILFPYTTSGYFAEATQKNIDENTIFIFDGGTEVARFNLVVDNNLDSFLNDWLSVSEIEVLNPCHFATEPSYFYSNYRFENASGEESFDPIPAFLENGKSQVLLVPKSHDILAQVLPDIEQYAVDGLLFVGPEEKSLFERNYDWDLSTWTDGLYRYDIRNNSGEQIPIRRSESVDGR